MSTQEDEYRLRRSEVQENPKRYLKIPDLRIGRFQSLYYGVVNSDCNLSILHQEHLDAYNRDFYEPKEKFEQISVDVILKLLYTTHQIRGGVFH